MGEAADGAALAGAERQRPAPAPPPEGGLHDQDLFFDAYVELAFQAYQQLQKAFGGPTLDEVPGALGGAWRAAYQPEPDPAAGA